MDKFIAINHKFKSLDPSQNFFIKIYSPEFRSLTLQGFGRVKSVHPEQTFRFWKFTQKNKYHYGVIYLEYFAIGEFNLKEEESSIEMTDNVFNLLKKSSIRWTHLTLTDEYEW